MADIITQRNKAYVELVAARKQLAFILKIVSHPLPKKIYTKRKSHKKANFVAAKSGNERQSKWQRLNMERMAAEMIFRQKEQTFHNLLKDYELKNKGSIKDIIDANRS